MGTEASQHQSKKAGSADPNKSTVEAAGAGPFMDWARKFIDFGKRARGDGDDAKKKRNGNGRPKQRNGGKSR